VNDDCLTLRPLVGSYVLGGLSAEETEVVRAHLATCPGCGSEHARLAPLRRPGWLAAGLATAVAAAAVAVLVLAGGGGRPGYDVTLQASAAVPRASAWAELEQVPGGTSMDLWVKGLPRDARTVYEVQCDAPGWSASAGTFRVGPDGAAHVVLTTAARRGEYDAIRIVRRGDHRVVFRASLT
jgi:anti-sigma factor RsiW